MGYTHYWRRKKTFSKDRFSRVVEDFKNILPVLEGEGAVLAGPLGKGEPTVNTEGIHFNGPENCEHNTARTGIAWPVRGAGGVSQEPVVRGQWLAGALLGSRSCGGDCSHETFGLPREMEVPAWESPSGDGLHFEFCKTAFKPYDLAVTAALVIAKHHLDDEIRVASDGELEQWMDAAILCENALGYGNDFRLED